MSRAWATGIIFALLVLLAPWPWYLIAVGGLLPIAAIIVMALQELSSPVVAMLLALCAALGIAAFYFLARRLGRRAQPWVVAAMAGLLAFVSLLPIYGGGENIATPAGKFADAWTAYRGLLARHP